MKIDLLHIAISKKYKWNVSTWGGLIGNIAKLASLKWSVSILHICNILVFIYQMKFIYKIYLIIVTFKG